MSRNTLSLLSLVALAFACGPTGNEPADGTQKKESDLAPCPSFVPPPPCPGREIPGPVSPGGCQLPPTCETDCGGLLGLSCAADAYCNFADNSCGAADQLGTCELKPEACIQIYSPVCGCDGTTYGNHCEAASHGVDTVSSGACPIQQACGSRGMPECPADYVCIFELGASCGRADAPGSCKPIVTEPNACTEEYAPVCGCDGTTYGNACAAANANASVDHAGECAP